MVNKYNRQSDIVWRDEGEGGSPQVILMVSDMIHQLNEVGSRVWLLCDGKKSVADIITTIASDYEVTNEVVGADVEEFIADLTAKNWLVDAAK